MTDKLSSQTLATIRNAIAVAQMAGVESLVIDSASIRGQSVEHATAMITPTSIPLEFDALGLDRLNLLNNRLNLIGDTDNCEATVEYDGTRLTKIKFKSKRTTIEFRCTDPTKIRAPKQVNDPIFYTFDIPEDTVALLMRSNIAMDADVVTFKVVQDGRVLIRVVDTGGDVLEHEVASNVTLSSVCDQETFSGTYKTKKLIPLLKDCARGGKTEVNITRRAIFGVSVKNLNVYVMQEI